MNLLEIIKRWWQEAAPIARAGVVVGGLTALASVGYLLSRSGFDQPVPLFVGMSTTDASALARELESRRIPHELTDNGTTIAVSLPEDEMRKLRLELSTEGLPTGQVTGWDIFDDSSITLTEFERKVMYQRALQGELSRTVSELPQVRSARVHLALPTRSLLERDGGEASASVYVSLQRGRSLSDKVAAGIAHLVSSSVPGLSAERIAIMDGNGTLIRAPDDGSGGGRRELELRQDRERGLEKDIVELLEKTVGPGHVMAKVAVDMDLSRTEETLEQYDADNTALRTERKTTEQTESERSQPAAIAGIQMNLPQIPAEGDQGFRGSKSNSNRKIDTKEFAVPRTVRQIVKPSGEIRKLSVAVLVDSTSLDPLPEPPAEEGIEVPAGGEVAPANARPSGPSPELIAALVKNAVGFDADRGDQIEISFVPFVRPDTVGGEDVKYIESKVATWLWVLVTLFVGLALVAASLWVTERRRREAALAEFARQLEEKDQLLVKQQSEADDTIPNSTRLRQEVRELTAKNVAATVEIMKGWLRPTLGRG